MLNFKCNQGHSSFKFYVAVALDPGEELPRQLEESLVLGEEGKGDGPHLNEKASQIVTSHYLL